MSSCGVRERSTSVDLPVHREAIGNLPLQVHFIAQSGMVTWLPGSGSPSQPLRKRCLPLRFGATAALVSEATDEYFSSLDVMSSSINDVNVHGALMVVAWVGLVPLAIILARHK